MFCVVHAARRRCVGTTTAPESSYGSGSTADRIVIVSGSSPKCRKGRRSSWRSGAMRARVSSQFGCRPIRWSIHSDRPSVSSWSLSGTASDPVATDSESKNRPRAR
jgi:hypothetical protein